MKTRQPHLPLLRLLILGLAFATALRAETAPSINLAIAAEPRNDWMQRHESFNAPARQGGIDLIFLGDSITDGWKGGGKPIWA